MYKLNVLVVCTSCKYSLLVACTSNLMCVLVVGTSCMSLLYILFLCTSFMN